MMKLISIIFALGFVFTSQGICVFGDHLVQTARLGDLRIDPGMEINSGSTLAPGEYNQLINGFKAHNYEIDENTTLEEILGFTDEGRIDALAVYDISHKRSFTAYIYSAGDNIHGFFISNADNSVAAIVGDGSIYNCKAQYTNYDDLDWFYTN